jgi:lactate dehydrogenase-like 2-hydroxyacid dehydrogenase
LIGAEIDDLAGATVGLIERGDIGTAVAERLIPFDSRIVCSSRRRRSPTEEMRLRATWLPLPELLRESTIVSLHLPLTTVSYHLVGDAELAVMPKGSYLVNPACGGLVDEAALGEQSRAGTWGEQPWMCSSMRLTVATCSPTCQG